MSSKEPVLNCEPHATSHGFTIILNDALRDSRLSWRAKGILAGCLSHAPGFRFDRDWIAQHGKESAEAVSSALEELRALGYMESRLELCETSGMVTGERLIFRDQVDGQRQGESESQVSRASSASANTDNWQKLPISSARKSKKLVATKEMVPIKLQPVAHLVCNFFNNHKGGQKTKQALDGLIANLLRIAEDSGGGIDHVKKQLMEAIERSEAGEKKWASITYSNWERFAKASKPKWDQPNNRPATTKIVSKFSDDAPAAMVL